MSEEKIKVLIADDHTVVRKGLSALLSDEKYGIEVVGEASDGDEAVKNTLILMPDVILMDLVMPGVGGLEAIERIKAELPEAHILVLTSFADDENILDAIKSGAHGFLLKDAAPDELVRTIKLVYHDQLTLPRAYTNILLGNIDRNKEEDSFRQTLTTRELDVIQQIALGLSNAQIANALTISTTTVRSHISNMLRKLDLKNRTQLAIYARDHHLD
jgi:DNA-binding NarL/FixJ family response regulator